MQRTSLRNIRRQISNFEEAIEELERLAALESEGVDIPESKYEEYHQDALDALAEIEDIISDSMDSANTIETPNGTVELPEQARGEPARSREERGRPEPDETG